jgi:AcrR family transcriptional regulator
MPRLSTGRAPAEPVRRDQRDRRDRILGVAARMGAELGLEGVQMAAVAGRAGVALGTLYRYYPSKNHLFAGVLAHNVDRTRSADRPRRSGSPAEAVADLMAGACAAMLEHPRLARAMINAVNAVRSEPGAPADPGLRDRIVAVAGIDSPSEDDLRLARLVEQCSYGVLTWAVAGETAREEAVADVRRACLLLLEPWKDRRLSDPAGRTPRRSRRSG